MILLVLRQPNTSLNSTLHDEIMASTTSVQESLFPRNDVLYFDHDVMKNVQETYKGATSHVEWSPKSVSSVVPTDDLIGKFQSIPLHATIDRRPLIVRKQMYDDHEAKLTAGGKLMGCALTGSTFVSNLKHQEVDPLDDYKECKPQCDVCFQFSNREDMANFVPGVGYEPLKKNQESTATKCFTGRATMHARFAHWQKTSRKYKDEDFGHQWHVDCMLPDGIQELTCREISRMQEEIEGRDELQKISFRTRIEMDASFDESLKRMFVDTEWPWTAVMTHDDDRSKIARGLNRVWNDVNSNFVPRNHREMTLAHVEGPGYDMSEFQGSLSLKSMLNDKESKGGVHKRLVTNLFHLIRNSPKSTHMIAVVDGQARRSYEFACKLLNTDIQDMYKEYGRSAFGHAKSGMDLIPIDAMSKESFYFRAPKNMSLMELLRMRGIKIHMIPIITPSLVFERTVCGGQYTFPPYLAARFAADYQVMMFIDGDTTLIESKPDKTLNEILYDRFFSEESSKCAGHRLRLIEQHVKPEHETVEKVLQCTQELWNDKEKWAYANKNCNLKEGHIVARTDSIYSFSIHHPETLPEYLPEGLDDCVSWGNKENDRYFLTANEFVQLHLRDRERKAECTCFVNHE